MKLHDKKLQWIYNHTDMLQRAVIRDHGDLEKIAREEETK